MFLLVFSASVWAQDTTADTVIPDRPNPPRLVNDFVGILSSSERTQLEQKLRAYNDSTSTQITIVIVRTTEPYPIGDFAFQVGRKWGVGQQGKNNGLVLAWATQTRKIYIATGYGVEGAVPDAIAKRIISNTIVPAFKQEQWYQGLDAATTEIIQRLQGEYKGEPKSSSDDEGAGTFFIVLIIFLIIIFIIARKNRGGGNNRNRGGGWGGPVFLPTPGWGSGWGSSGGGGWSGGGSSGGGFGGFGGGSFGGGGAGGDY
ncbi:MULTISPECIES: YgcG family protein [unclassified Spirosoma]|uniref:TPM domain-containing protein n=1 Tax=unclassified Spirosoma TaxID=2621999 RepID=UPI000A5BAC28|nr:MULTISPECIES: TPM domain-containing protein [unclassified Spirosoma]MBN8825440.1 TPM domain-containing protein [Spirosoma sp.]